MPRLDHRADVETMLSASQKAIIAVLLTELNTLRQAAHLPPRTMQELRQAVRDAWRQQQRGS